MKDQKVGFRPDQLNTIGQKVPTTLMKALWFIDPHRDKLAARGIHVPPIFETLFVTV